MESDEAGQFDLSANLYPNFWGDLGLGGFVVKAHLGPFKAENQL